MANIVTFLLKSFSPLFLYKISGNSMYPTFQHGEVILANKLSYIFSTPKIDNVVVVKRKEKNMTILKRITSIENSKFFVEGDNKQESTDSRDFGMIEKEEIIGKVLFKISH